MSGCYRFRPAFLTRRVLPFSTGVRTLGCLPKARFIASLVDGYDGQEPKGFDEAADLVGESKTEVMAAYRNFKILLQASSEFRINTSAAEEEFGVFTRAMSTNALRQFIGAPQPRFVERGDSLLTRDQRVNVRTLLKWLFGTARGDAPVIGESRHLNQLARVVASEDGRQVLATTGDLEAAEEAIGGPRDRLLKRLSKARRYLVAAAQDIDLFQTDEEIVGMVAECQQALTFLEDSVAEEA